MLNRRTFKKVTICINNVTFPQLIIITLTTTRIKTTQDTKPIERTVWKCLVVSGCRPGHENLNHRNESIFPSQAVSALLGLGSNTTQRIKEVNKTI